MKPCVVGIGGVSSLMMANFLRQEGASPIFPSHFGFYRVYSFILATSVDNNIIPGLMKYLWEINEITSEDIAIILPKYSNLVYGKSKEVSLDVEEIYGLQAQEIIQIARFFGVGLDKMPCILFFDTFDNPSSYLIWQLKDQDAPSIVVDFRKIVAALEKNRDELVSEDKNELDIIQSLNRKKYIRQMICDLGKTAPIVGLGLSAANVFCFLKNP